jgi:hypothetical protein
MRVTLSRGLTFVTANVVVALMASMAQAVVIVETMGAVSPAENGFGIGGLGGEVGTDTEGHFRTHGFAGLAANFRVDPFGDPTLALNDPATVRVRSEATGNNIQNSHVQVTDDTDAWVIGFLDDGPSGPGAYVWGLDYLPATRISSFSPSDYHTYQMIYDPAGNSGNGVVHYWVDGIDTGFQQARTAVSPDGPNRFLLGCYTTGGDFDYETRWSLARFETGQHPIAPDLTGDYNADGKVDAADYVVWRKNDGGTNTLPNDPIGGTIGQGQYDNWRARFGTGVTPATGTSLSTGVVPEPTTISLLFAVILAGAVARRRPLPAAT